MQNRTDEIDRVCDQRQRLHGYYTWGESEKKSRKGKAKEMVENQMIYKVEISEDTKVVVHQSIRTEGKE